MTPSHFNIQQPRIPPDSHPWEPDSTLNTSQPGERWSPWLTRSWTVDKNHVWCHLPDGVSPQNQQRSRMALDANWISEAELEQTRRSLEALERQTSYWWPYFKQDVNANHTAWTSEGFFCFPHTGDLKIIAFKQGEEGQCTVAMKTTKKVQKRRSSSLHPFQPQVLIRSLAAPSWGFFSVLFWAWHQFLSTFPHLTTRPGPGMEKCCSFSTTVPMTWWPLPAPSALLLSLPLSGYIAAKLWKHSHWPRHFISQRECHCYSTGLCPCPACNHQSCVKFQLMHQGLPNQILAERVERNPLFPGQQAHFPG